jgi:hypothetical protein
LGILHTSASRLAFFRAPLDESLQVSLVLDFSAHNLAFFKALRFVWSYFRDGFIRSPLLAPNCRDNAALIEHYGLECPPPRHLTAIIAVEQAMEAAVPGGIW